MKETRNTVIIALLVIAGFAATILTIRSGSQSASQNVDVGFTRKLATTLESHGLWDKAAVEYSKLLDNPALSPVDRANISLHLAEIYLDHLLDSNSALPHLFAVKVISRDITHNSELEAKADKRIVEALEKSGRSIDAANYLKGASSIEPEETTSGDTGEVVLAKVGDKKITLSQLTAEIQALPPEMQEQFKDPNKKIEALQNMVVKKLLLTAAKRAGHDTGPEIERASQMARDSAILIKFQKNEIDSKIRITEADVRGYYESHKDDFSYEDEKGKKTALPYNDVKDRARGMLDGQRRRELIDEVINRLHQSEGVEIYRDRIEGK